jgi:2-polyprenyl-3-methyl-5-hydroxy-6-metoxy-1,4-benzoquinol methylase
VYELGCAEGTLLKAFKALGSDVLGHEVDPATAKWVTETHGFPCMSGLFPESRPTHLGPHPEPQLFQVVCGFDVLEHVLDPVGFVQAAYDHVEPGGLMVLQTPWYRDQGAAFKHFQSPEHVYLWSAEAAKALYTKAGVPLDEVSKSHFAHDMLLWSRK